MGASRGEAGEVGEGLTRSVEPHQHTGTHLRQIDGIRKIGATDLVWEQCDRLATQLGLAQLPIHTVIEGVCTCARGSSCKEKGKHPILSNGVKGATADRQQLWAWHCQWPWANWALACGSISRTVVVDIDPEKGGRESWEEYEQNRRGSDLPLTTQVLTGGLGKHLIFSIPLGARVPNRVNWLPGVDIRGDNGYAVLPGSRHVTGRAYEWLNPGIPLAEAPIDLLEAIRAGRSRPSSAGGSRSSGEFIAPTDELRARGFRHGERDDGFNRLAWRLVRQHWPHMDLVVGIMREVYDRTDQFGDPMTWEVVEDKIARARDALVPQINAERSWMQGLRSTK